MDRSTDQLNQSQAPADAMPAANTGNASNPSPQPSATSPASQLLNEKAEKYLAESGNIEDLPDPEEEQEPEDEEKA